MLRLEWYLLVVTGRFMAFRLLVVIEKLPVISCNYSAKTLDKVFALFLKKWGAHRRVYFRGV